MIPAELRALKGWVLWKLLPPEKPGGKPRKVPFYTNGGRRRGVQGSPQDRAHWASYDEAVSILENDIAGEYEGLGLVMSPDWGIVGLDFDHCVDKTGRVDPAVMAVIEGTYSEYSPSGEGVHAFLSGAIANAKSHWTDWGWGFETFCTTGFLTMTGRATDVCELVGWDTLDHVNGAVTDLFESRFGGVHAIRAPRVVGESVTPPRGMSEAEVRALLWRCTHDGRYMDWFSRGCALHHESSGAQWGCDLWIEHSLAGADPSTAEIMQGKWNGMDSSGETRPVITIAYLESIARPDDSGFDDISGQDDRPPVAAMEWHDTRGGDEVPRIDPPPLDPAPATPARLLAKVKRKGIPEAHHLCTDQANAQRLKNAFGSFVFVAAGKWHVWDRRRWHADESDVYRYGCQLSELIGAEAKAWRAKAAPLLASTDAAEIAEGKKMGLVADALVKWAVKSEMKGCIEAAIGLARKMLTLDVDQLDRDPDLLNVANGTVDLRTGVLRPHDPADYITKLVPVAYRPEARCDEWLRALEQISGGLPGWVDYLRRWAGYCLTGRTTEQVFVVLWGPGGNGKGVVVGVLTATMGDYAGTAAPGLLVASKGAERHPTEIAALMGRRMVTAHETSEGVVLREDFVKQATGGDRLTARWMREDFFEFDPVHKLQLLTNHKPQIKGQDLGIWRRVTLLPFVVTFGEAWQVADGSRMKLLDKGLLEKLQAELEGVLAWRVRGAVEWAQTGLQPPDVVKVASEDYKREQDRVGQFVGECCEIGVEWSEPLTEGLGGGLYPAYTGWCKDGGVFPLSKTRFKDEVLRVLPVGRVEDRLLSIAGGGRRKVKLVHGLRLLQE